MTINIARKGAQEGFAVAASIPNMDVRENLVMPDEVPLVGAVVYEADRFVRTELGG